MMPFAKSASGSAGVQQQQQQQLGAFVHQSVAASSPHDPLLTLASHAIRNNFGVIVQTVADCLQCRGDIPLAKILFYLQQHKKRKCMTQGETVPTTPQVRAALLVLMQHSIVTVKQQQQQQRVVANHNSSGKAAAATATTAAVVISTVYRYHPDIAVHMIRHAKFVEYLRKAGDAVSACVVEELLLAGRLRTVDLIVQAAEHAPKSEKYTVRQSVMDAVCKLVNAGFVVQVAPLPSLDDDDDDEEMEFEPAKKRVTLSVPDDDNNDTATMQQQQKHNNTDEQLRLLLYQAEDPAVVALLHHHAHYKATLPVDSVWRVNTRMFHENLRAYHFGKLVSERHGHRVQSAGSLVTAALKYRAHVTHTNNNSRNPAGTCTGESAADGADLTVFCVTDIVKYLPKAVLQLMEKKVGGVTVNLHKAWRDLSELSNPQVVRCVGDNDRYEISVNTLSNYLTDRIMYQVILDRHGEVAARVASILLQKGYLESDRLAETAMVPAKDTREVLHHLYRSHYVELFQLSNSRQYNPANTIYLWGIERNRLVRKVTENTATALWNIRLRREHEVEVVGKNWIERAQQAADTDENDHETDKLNYQKFCLGLERLDVAVLQLDETLMALCDF